MDSDLENEKLASFNFRPFVTILLWSRRLFRWRSDGDSARFWKTSLISRMFVLFVYFLKFDIAAFSTDCCEFNLLAKGYQRVPIISFVMTKDH